eukprot:TRINITY_DN41685_c0_g1_i1.p1 TRINITY_DN41685_c0_g1~~TRINITY_DN41685_c0_g1_i1.p1  ORF type:complete len:507 (-),score=118.17 TRINITY_DN41685_c0_g1_i1:76-1545(-)
MVLELFGRDVEECSKQLLRIPVLHPHFEAVLVETIFSQMLRLPTPQLLPLFYFRLLQAIAEKQASVKKLVEKAFNHLFTHASVLDEESLEVLAESFAFHLMGNAYEADWGPFTGDSVAVQGQRLVRRALDRLQRLSFHQNLISRLPEAIHVHIPPEPLPMTGLAVQAKPEFAQTCGMIKIKGPDADKLLRYANWLQHVAQEEESKGKEASSTGAEENKEGDDAKTENAEGSDAKRRKLEDGSAEATKGSADKDEFGEKPEKPWTFEEVTELFAVAVLQQGAKTPTHFYKVMDGHQKVLIKLKPDEEEKAHSFGVRITQCVFDFWKQAGQRLEVSIDTLLHRGVITPRAVVETALSQRGQQGCDSMSVWNIINGVARKSLERSQTVRVELAIAKKLGKEDVLEKSRKALDEAIHENAELFTLIFTGLVRNYQDFQDHDDVLRNITLQRITTIARKYLSFIKPLVDAAESRIPGVGKIPEVMAVFQRLRTL